MDGPPVPSFSIISHYPFIPLDPCAIHDFNLSLSAFSPTHSLLLSGVALKRAQLSFASQLMHDLNTVNHYVRMYKSYEGQRDYWDNFCN